MIRFLCYVEKARSQREKGEVYCEHVLFDYERDVKVEATFVFLQDDSLERKDRVSEHAEYQLWTHIKHECPLTFTQAKEKGLIRWEILRSLAI